MLSRLVSTRGLQALCFVTAAITLFHGEKAGGAVTPAAPTLAVDGLGKGTAALDGPWQFHLGDDPAWAAPALDDSSWEQLTASKPWGMQGHESYTGYAWYRRRISITPAHGASPDIALYVPLVEDAYELYWNGVLVGRDGKLPPNPDWSISPTPQTFGLGQIRTGVLAVRVWKAPLVSFDSGAQGGFSGLPLVGSPEAIAAHKDTYDYQWLRRRQFTFGLDSLYALVVLLGLLAWLRDRSQWLLFWMAGFALGPLLLLLLLGLRIPWSYDTALGLAQPCFGMTDVSLWFVLVWLLQLHENPRLLRLVRIFAVIDIAGTSMDGLLSIVHWSPGWVLQVQLADAVLTGIFTLLEVIPPVLVTYAIVQRQKLDPARWLVAIFAFLTEMISVVRIASEQGRRYTHWTISDKIAAPLFTLNGNPITAQTLAAALLLVSIVYAVYRYSVEERKRQSSIEQEFKNARELQQVLVPETLPSLPGFTLTSAYRPAQEVGGDFFQIIPLEGGSTLVILGDVSGKGLKAAMAVSLIVGAARMVAEFTSSPAEILAGLNRRLYGRLQGGFATCVAMRLDPDGSCAIASAGHPAPILNDRELNLPGAIPLGLLASSDYEENTFSLQAGDHCALYTDGLLEARNQAGELYSFARLQDLFSTRPNAAEATQAAVNFGQDDDITVLTLTRLAMGHEPAAIHSVAGL
jgi:hypothetical protein